MAHVQMAAEGIQHPNKRLPKSQLDRLSKVDKKHQWRDSRFATAWREYAQRRAAQAAHPITKKKGAART